MALQLNPCLQYKDFWLLHSWRLPIRSFRTFEHFSSYALFIAWMSVTQQWWSMYLGALIRKYFSYLFYSRNCGGFIAITKWWIRTTHIIFNFHYFLYMTVLSASCAAWLASQHGDTSLVSIYAMFIIFNKTIQHFFIIQHKINQFGNLKVQWFGSWKLYEKCWKILWIN